VRRVFHFSLFFCTDCTIRLLYRTFSLRLFLFYIYTFLYRDIVMSDQGAVRKQRTLDDVVDRLSRLESSVQTLVGLITSHQISSRHPPNPPHLPSLPTQERTYRPPHRPAHHHTQHNVPNVTSIKRRLAPQPTSIYPYTRTPAAVALLQQRPAPPPVQHPVTPVIETDVELLDNIRNELYHRSRPAYQSPAEPFQLAPGNNTSARTTPTFNRPNSENEEPNVRHNVSGSAATSSAAAKTRVILPAPPSPSPDSNDAPQYNSLTPPGTPPLWPRNGGIRAADAVSQFLKRDLVRKTRNEERRRQYGEKQKAKRNSASNNNTVNTNTNNNNNTPRNNTPSTKAQKLRLVAFYVWPKCRSCVVRAVVEEDRTQQLSNMVLFLQRL